jgi:hypothetical protein
VTIDHLGRRNFIKTTTLAGVAAATIPAKTLLGQDARKSPQTKAAGIQKQVLCIGESPQNHQHLIESIKSIPGADLLVSTLSADYQRPQEIVQAVQKREPDVLLMFLSGFMVNFGNLYDSMGDVKIPIIMFAANSDFIMVDANIAAAFRGNGANVKFAISEAQVIEWIRNMVLPRILEGKRALVFGTPFDSVSVPARNLTAEEVYKRTGVILQYRSLEELSDRLKSIDEASARSEMERWKKEAVEVVRVPDALILDVCRLYVLLRSLVEKEKLSAVSMDCLNFTLGMGAPRPNVSLPVPCLAFARLRDEGITAACEADVCGLISSMFLETISRKPSFMANVVMVDLQNSRFVFSHCVSPLKMNGLNAAPLRYRLHDYHNMEKGVVPEVEFPEGMEVLTGAFGKNLKTFTLWPGRILSQVKETERTPPNRSFGLNTCANTIDIKIKDAGRFLQNITSIHHIMIAGKNTKAIEDALLGMNVSIVTPSDLTAPEPEKG